MKRVHVFLEGRHRAITLTMPEGTEETIGERYVGYEWVMPGGISVVANFRKDRIEAEIEYTGLPDEPPPEGPRDPEPPAAPVPPVPPVSPAPPRHTSPGR